MKRLLSFLLLSPALGMLVEAQQVVPLSYDNNDEPQYSSVVEDTLYSEQGTISAISQVTSPSMSVYLPDPRMATGTGVVVLPGGGLRILSWENEGVRVARWLNSKGVAAFVLKYRLYNSSMDRESGNRQNSAPLIQLSVDQFDQLQNANTNPSDDPQMDKVLQMATSDALEAMRLVREKADQWNVRPDRIGYLGFSAGGCVALSAVITNKDPYTLPDFIASAYGPSLIDVVVPESAPPLFIAANADHMNVAAGCLALFTEWKKAGAPAEIHLYDKGQGPFGMRQTGNPSDTWIDSFYTWLHSYGY